MEEQLAHWIRFMTVSTGGQRGREEFDAMEVHHIHVNTLHQQSSTAVPVIFSECSKFAGNRICNAPAFSRTFRKKNMMNIGSLDEDSQNGLPFRNQTWQWKIPELNGGFNILQWENHP